MEKKYVLAVDQSTQGTKAILFDVNGDLVCRTDLPHRQLINEKAGFPMIFPRSTAIPSRL